MSLLWKTATATEPEIHHEDHGPFVDFLNTGGGRLTATVPGHSGEAGYLNYQHWGPNEIGIDYLFVHPSHQRKGIGTAMMDRLRDLHPGKEFHTEDMTGKGKAWARGYEHTRGTAINWEG